MGWITAFSSFNFATLLCQEKQEGIVASKNWSGMKTEFSSDKFGVDSSCMRVSIQTFALPSLTHFLTITGQTEEELVGENNSHIN